VHEAGRHLLAMIDDVLDLARVEGGELHLARQPVVLESLVADALAAVQPAARARGVELHVRGLESTVLADGARLRQVLLNLLDNAIKFNHEGGHVTVDARSEGAEVVLRVADSGRGLSARQLQHLYEPFNRLGAERDAVPGTGIGLAVVKALVETMGGRIEVTSQLGAGSVFALRLPAAPGVATPAPAVASDEQTSRQPGPRPRLLCVEDNPSNALILREFIERRGDFELVITGDGCSGLAHARALQPALVLLDMQLPDLDGLEVLRRLRADPATAAIPVIAVSANAMPEDIRRAVDAGIDDYWTKPLDFEAFGAALDRRFGRSAG
jgi:CheY-like chemotaxis protein